MRVDDSVRLSVVYIGAPKVDGTSQMLGTGFMVAKPVPGYPVHEISPGRKHLTGMFMYLVTARHVIDGVRGLGAETVVVRANRKTGGWAEMHAPISSFTFHPDPSVDLAVVHADDGLPEWEIVPWFLPDAVTEVAVVERNIGIGTPVAIAGLFRYHAGIARNLPIVRTGNIAAMAEEKLHSKLGLMDAILIEARSLGGLSGSPVFTNLSLEHLYDSPVPRQERVSSTLLLGVMHGHFDETIDGQKLNVGIGIVTPATKLLELLSDPAILESEYKVLQRQRARDLLGPKPVSRDRN